MFSFPSSHAIASPKAELPWLVTIAASAGGIEALQVVLRDLPQDLPAAVVIVQHRPASDKKSYLRRILARAARLPVADAHDEQPIVPGTIYIARPDLHLTVSGDKRFSYVDGTRIRFLYSSANPLFETAAAAFGTKLVAIVLTGGGRDATDGVQTVRQHHGTVIVQDPQTARHGSMPRSALETGAVDYVLPLEAIAAAVTALVNNQPVAGAQLR